MLSLPTFPKAGARGLQVSSGGTNARIIGLPLVPTVTTIPGGTAAGLLQLLQALAVDAQTTSLPAPPASAAVPIVIRPPATAESVPISGAPLPFVMAVVPVVEAPAVAVETAIGLAAVGRVLELLRTGSGRLVNFFLVQRSLWT